MAKARVTILDNGALIVLQISSSWRTRYWHRWGETFFYGARIFDVAESPPTVDLGFRGCQFHASVTRRFNSARAFDGACANWGANCLDAGWSRFCQDLGDGSPSQVHHRRSVGRVERRSRPSSGPDRLMGAIHSRYGRAIWWLMRGVEIVEQAEPSTC